MNPPSPGIPEPVRAPVVERADGDVLDRFHPAVRAWFEEQFDVATEVQRRGWESIAAGNHTLLSAPTGSGKTLAAFLWSISDLVRQPEPDKSERLRLLYVSPLRALNYDIERNLRAPLIGIQRHAAQLGIDIPDLRVGVRTGDTSQKERNQHRRNPPDIFITTPESLYVMLTSGARELFDSVQTIIVDEIHALASTKRGTHMAVTLERLAERTGAEVQRIALSATQRPIERIAAFVAGAGREMSIVEAPMEKRYDLRVCVPVDDMTAIGGTISTRLDDLDTPKSNSPSADGYSIWSAMYEELLDLVEAHRSTIVFTNSRRLSERVAQALNERAERRALQRALAELGDVEDLPLGEDDPDDPLPSNDDEPGPPPSDDVLDGDEHDLDQSPSLDTFFEEQADRGEPIEALGGDPATAPPEAGVVARAHHGSIARETRKAMEEQLKAGLLPAIIATSSLELGIDMGAVDLVVHIESPSSVASGIQRVGRAGHQVGSVSVGRIYPKHRMDLVEAAAVTRAIVAGDIEPVHVPELCLDVLAQQIVAIAAEREYTVDDLYALVTRAWPYRELTREQFENLLQLLAGYFPGDDLADLRPRIVWDRETDTVLSRRDAARIAITNAGTIPDRGLYGVFLPDGKTRVGELDEEMVHETRLGEIIVLGATSWRVENVTRDRVLVTPVPGAIGKTPFWHGEGAGRTTQLGRAVGQLVREVASLPAPDLVDEDGSPRGEGEAPPAAEDPAVELLEREYLLDPRAARNLAAFVREQADATGDVPSDTTIVVERFRDELGDWRICILSPYGKAVHGPWAMAIEAQIAERHDVGVTALWSDDGIALRLPDTGNTVPLDSLLVDPDAIEDMVIAQLGHSALFAGRFREIVTRALLLPLARFDRRSPLWLQRIKAHDVLRVAQRHPSFPMILEAYRECLRDVFDMQELRSLLRRMQNRELRVVEVETRMASPFASSLLFDYSANLIYDGDQPAAERRAQALALDQNLLRELLGTDEIRDLLDAEAIEAVEEELQRLVEQRRATSIDQVHDLLRELGDLTEAEVAARSVRPDAAAEALTRLVARRRAACVRIAGERRYVAIEDAGTYRDAFGVQPPKGIPEVFLQPSVGEGPAPALDRLVWRYVRTHGPFSTERIARRWGVAAQQLEPALERLEHAGEAMHGGFLPAGTEPEWVDPEVLRRIRRRTLAMLRKEIEPIDQQALARFLLAWHSLDNPPAGGLSAVRDAVVQLEGIEVAAPAWEGDLVAPRVANYRRAWLDELVQTGQVVWMGRGVKNSTLTVGLYLREHFTLMAPEPAELPDDDHVRAVYEALQQRGASFVLDLTAATGLGEGTIATALWRLAAAGHMTNDSWQTLRDGAHRASDAQKTRADRQLTHAKRANRGRRRASLRRGVSMTRRTGAGAAPGGEGGSPWQGRWSLLPATRESEHDRLQALAETLLDCYGVVTRSVANVRSVPGGFSAVYRELARQEELGGVRRGYFVDGMGGAQFALPEAVDRLRAVREPLRDKAPVIVLRANDPAQPYGSLLPWPERDELPTPNRSGTNYVLQRDGALLGVFSPSGRSLVVYDLDTLPAIAAALTALVERRRIDRVTIEQLNGSALEQAQVVAFANTGFVRTPRGVRVTSATLPGAGAGRGRGRSAGAWVPTGSNEDVALPTHGRRGDRQH